MFFSKYHNTDYTYYFYKSKTSLVNFFITLSFINVNLFYLFLLQDNILYVLNMISFKELKNENE